MMQRYNYYCNLFYQLSGLRASPVNQGPGLKRLRILMLEADPEDARAVEEELGKAGVTFESVRAETQLEFESQLRGFKPHVVLSDFWLPDLDGLSALATTLEKAPGVPFIFVSGAMGEELAIEAMRNGAADYVLKVDLSRLAPSLGRALREAEERDERILAEAKLIESEGRLRKIIESVATGVLIVDPETHQIVDANKAALQMVGAARNKVVGRPCYGLACPARKGECPVTDLGHELDHAEVFLRRSSGETLTVLKTVTPVVLEGREHLLESFVQPDRFRGTCYQAANWIHVGQTTGRTRQNQRHRDNAVHAPVKDIYLYPLTTDVRHHLCR